MRSLIFLALLSVALATPFTAFSQCDSGATYHVSISTVDITPYPIQPGHDATILLSGNADNAYTLTQATATVLGIKQSLVLTQSINTGSSSITVTLPGAQIPTLIPDGTYSVQIVVHGYLTADASKADVQLNCYNMQIQFKKAAALKVESGLTVPFTGYTQCVASATYHVSISSADVNPYPIQQGKDVVITLNGVSDNAYTLTQATANVLGIQQSLALTQTINSGSQSFQITIPGSQIPTLIPDGTYSVQIVVHGYLTADASKADVQLNCYNMQLQFKKAAALESTLINTLALDTPFTGYTLCVASATYHVSISSADVNPYPIQQGRDVVISLNGVSDNAYTLTQATANFLGIQQSLALTQSINSGSQTVSITIPGSQIPTLIPDGTYSVQIVLHGYLTADASKADVQLNCYNMQMQFKKATQTLTLIKNFVKSQNFLKANPTHYGNPTQGCQGDETAAQITGLNGDACIPKCTSTGSCPTDVPSGTTAQPLCALQTSTGDKYCALICSGVGADGNCPTGATCQVTSGVGICLYPQSQANPFSKFLN